MIEEKGLFFILFQEGANIMNFAHISHNKKYLPWEIFGFTSDQQRLGMCRRMPEYAKRKQEL